MEIFKNIATVVGCISACIALLITIIKPLRQWVINSIIKKSEDSTREKKVDKMDKKIDKLLETIQGLETRLARVEKSVLENEADRIRAELFDCGNRCRRGIQIGRAHV